MKEPLHPMKLQRELRLHLIDLQLSDAPHAGLIAQVYARLIELEAIAGKVSLVSVMDPHKNHPSHGNW